MKSEGTPTVLEILDRESFTVSAEIIPPRNGADITEIFQQINELHEAGFHFISVTHGAGGSLRGGTLPIAHYAQTKQNMTAIAHLTCRGFSREDLENILIDHFYFGIRNILALRGDPPTGSEGTFEPHPRGYRFAYELIAQIRNMNEGRYLVRPHFDPPGEYRPGLPTNFCIGAASYPEDPEPQRLEYLVKKKEAGAEFSITQMVFDLRVLEDFYARVTELWGHSFPILPGIRIPTSLTQLERLEKKFGVSIPRDLRQSMANAENKGAQAMHRVGEDWAVEFVEACRKMGIKGIHMFIMGNTTLPIKVKKRLRIPNYHAS
ncbi:MAG: methylenetetrahydrofolate reductase [Leptospiraceae bacterium]|nr:methylenetetrahydrofolate reductase [Leptospiraceae bacterium]MDW8305741.1 methylenetetrahydrofolate reductase [Leptospiraceae bacterium]